MSIKELRSDPVFQLITGKFEKIKIGSSVKEVFVPSKRNPHPTILELLKRERHSSRESILVREGLMQPRVIIDRSVFTKTDLEKDMLKNRKSIYKKTA